jgi:FkbM family methyltransferase
MSKINKNSIFYKLYLYYNLYFRHKALKKRTSYSQNQEDLFINDYFREKNKGFYIDIGCYHPIKYSNTALLYNRGWYGINIDMNPTSIDLFNIFRKRDINICAAISNKSHEATLYFDHLFSPINTLDKKFSETASKEISFNKHLEKKIYTQKFNELMQAKNIKIKKIDFINIDVEAHDFEVLEGIDLGLFNPKIICIEVTNSQSKTKLQNYLNKYNYHLIKEIGLNSFYELKN